MGLVERERERERDSREKLMRQKPRKPDKGWTSKQRLGNRA
jgi:hypothetical protein